MISTIIISGIIVNILIIIFLLFYDHEAITPQNTNGILAMFFCILGGWISILGFLIFILIELYKDHMEEVGKYKYIISEAKKLGFKSDYSLYMKKIIKTRKTKIAIQFWLTEFRCFLNRKHNLDILISKSLLDDSSISYIISIYKFKSNGVVENIGNTTEHSNIQDVIIQMLNNIKYSINK